jgi:hypothetical protein
VTRGQKIGWFDEFRIGLYGTTRRVLAPRGVKVRQRVEIVRDWYHLAAVVAPSSGHLEWAWLPNLKVESVAAAVEQWREHGFDALVCDRLRAHKSKAVRATGMPIILQPAMSPELDPAERVGEEIRDKVEGEVYGSIWHKMAAVERLLRDLAADAERVKQLTGYDWILAALRRLPLTPRKRWQEVRPEAQSLRQGY